MTAYEQRSYPGAAADTLLNADIASNALTFSVSPGTGNGYPTGGSGPFFVAIDYDTSKAEKIRVTSRINDTFTIASTADRGVDGTSAVAHSANAKVRAVWTATDAQEANRAAANTVGKVTTKGDLLAGTAANTLSRVGVGADGTLLAASAAAGAGVAWQTPAAAGLVTTAVYSTGISTYTPIYGGGYTFGNSTNNGYYAKLAANLYWFQTELFAGSTWSGYVTTLTLPATIQTTTGMATWYRWSGNNNNISGLAHGFGTSNTMALMFTSSTSNNPDQNFGLSSGDHLVVSGFFYGA